MKFKKVEISAFRIYDNPQDATFDFTSKEDVLADFISLYAPNGYGKTSFYDAIEWGVTNNISRFWKNESIAENAIEAQSEVNSDSIKLWRHTNSENETFVRITTDNPSESIYRELKPHGNAKIDASKKNRIERKEFQNVILSQEWISGFLKEIDGVKRYQIFMEAPQLQDIDSYYKNIRILITICGERISNASQNIEKLQSKVLQSQEDEFLSDINSTISLLTQMGEKLSLITPQTTQADIIKLRNTITDRLVTLRTDRRSKEIQYAINVVKEGTASICSIDTFYRVSEQIMQFRAQLESVRSLDFLFKERVSNKVSQSNLSARKVENEEALRETTEIIKKLPNYHRINNLINAKTAEKERLQALMNVQNREIEDSNRARIEISTKIARNNTELQQFQLILKQLPSHVGQLTESEKKLAVIESSIQDSEIKTQELNASINQHGIALHNLQTTYEKLVHGAYDNITKVEIPLGFTTRLVELLEAEKQRKVLSEKLTIVDTEAAQFKEFSNALNKLIDTGLRIINETQQSSCPLCEQNYESYAALASRISGNKLIDAAHQTILGRRTELTKKIADVENVINFIQQEWLSFFSREIENTSNGISQKNEALKTEQLKQAQLNTEKEKLLVTIKALRFIFNNEPSVDFERKTSSRLTEVEKEYDQNVNLQKDIDNRHQFLEDQQSNIKKQFVLLTDEINALKTESVFIDVDRWYKAKFSTEDVDDIKITEFYDLLNNKIEELTNQIKALEVSLEKLDNQLMMVSESGISEDIRKYEFEIQRILDQQQKFIDYVKSNFTIDISFVQRRDFELLLSAKSAEASNGVNLIEALHVEYEKLDLYSNNIYPFLQSEEAKKEIAQNQNLINYLESMIQPMLCKERDKARNYLEQKVKDFFYIDLINTIYNKIDPHPSFRAVDFRVDFDSPNPRLDIFVRKIGSGDLLIPNLYFSSAQINVLSLSIFLATALNTTEFNCIFIDDPIQSLDSINILSTIDLLRSIVINQGRQIVLSTHDPNFHNLLKKKLPSSQFNSKYLELESFGKVKVTQ